MAVVFRQEVLIDARRSRNRDAVRPIQCLDVEPMMSLTPAAVIEQVTNVRQDGLHDFQD
jgi:hypothetical protein